MYQLLAAVLIGIVVGLTTGIVGIHWIAAGVIAFVLSMIFSAPLGNWFEKINKEKTNG